MAPARVDRLLPKGLLRRAFLLRAAHVRAPSDPRPRSDPRFCSGSCGASLRTQGKHSVTAGLVGVWGTPHRRSDDDALIDDDAGCLGPADQHSAGKHNGC